MGVELTHKEISQRGGSNSRKNLSPKKRTFLARKANEVGWKGHLKKNKKCKCSRCRKKKGV